jgi:hypothetical protein
MNDEFSVLSPQSSVDLDDAIQALMERGIRVPSYDMDRLARALRGDGTGGLRLEELAAAADEAQDCHDLSWVLGRAEHRRLVLWQVTHPVLIDEPASSVVDDAVDVAAGLLRRSELCEEVRQFFNRCHGQFGEMVTGTKRQEDRDAVPGRLVVAALAVVTVDSLKDGETLTVCVDGRWINRALELCLSMGGPIAGEALKIIDEDPSADQNTADVVFQVGVFGKVVFG